jgi:hypothetical protein
VRHSPTQHPSRVLAGLPLLTLLPLFAFGCAKGAPIDPNEIVILTSLPGNEADAGHADAAPDAEAPISDDRITPGAAPTAGTAPTSENDAAPEQRPPTPAE